MSSPEATTLETKENAHDPLTLSTDLLLLRRLIQRNSILPPHMDLADTLPGRAGLLYQVVSIRLGGRLPVRVEDGRPDVLRLGARRSHSRARRSSPSRARLQWLRRRIGCACLLVAFEEAGRTGGFCELLLVLAVRHRVCVTVRLRTRGSGRIWSSSLRRVPSWSVRAGFSQRFIRTRLGGRLLGRIYFAIRVYFRRSADNLLATTKMSHPSPVKPRERTRLVDATWERSPNSTRIARSTRWPRAFSSASSSPSPRS